jgi:hypothetical protein
MDPAEVLVGWILLAVVIGNLLDEPELQPGGVVAVAQQEVAGDLVLKVAQ